MNRDGVGAALGVAGSAVTPAKGVAILVRAPGRVYRFLRRWPVLPVFILVLLVVAAIFAPWLEPHSPFAVSLEARLTPPAWFAKGSTMYLLGTDAVGRDILSRIIDAARITLVVVVIALSAGIVVGATMGMVAGYFGGVVDEVLMRIVDTWSALPYLLIMLTLVLVVGRGYGILIVALTLVSWPGAVRLVRAETLRIRTLDYIALAKVSGASNLHIIYKHVLPGVLDVIVVSATLHVGTLILTEATLSFLGAGVPPPNPSWGSMISDGRQYISSAWWICAFPGMAILLVTMAGNFLGDWLRDYLDPRLRQL